MRRGRALGAALRVAVLCLVPSVATQASPPTLVVTYDIHYSGVVSLDVGSATVQYGTTNSDYQLAMLFRPSASARSLSVGPAAARTTGVVASGKLMPQSSSVDYSVRSLTESRSFTFSGGRLQSVRITKKKGGGLFKEGSRVAYDPRSLPAYAPLTEAEQKGVIDPLSAMFLPQLGPSLSDHANCDRKLRVYDGRRRFDLVMTYEGVEPGGATGREALLCKASYLPIAGQSIDGDEFTESMRDYRVTVALVPAPNLAFLIPSRITLTDSGGAPVAEARAIAMIGR
jgi:Protein of unknown function (DUF3108)